MKNTESMKLNKDFKRLYYRGKSIIKSNIVVYANKNWKNYNRLGLTCSKSIGKAVKRNRVKRLMRESYRVLENRIKTGHDIVIVARTRAVTGKCIHVKNDLEYALKKLDLLIEDEKNTDSIS